MEESVTYQAILAKGALAEAKKMLMLLGREGFGCANTSARKAIEAIDEIERLEQLQLRVLKAASWDELLSMPSPRSGRKKPT